MQSNRPVGHVPDSMLCHQNSNASVNLSQNYNKQILSENDLQIAN